MKPHAVVVGTVAMDLVATSAQATTARAAVGNSGANIAVRLAAAGWNVDMVSLIGPDPLGRMITDDLRRWGVGTEGLVIREGYLSPRVFQVLDGTDRGTASLLVVCPRCSRPRGHRLEIPEPSELPAAVHRRATHADLLLVDVADTLSTELAAATQGTVWFEASLRESTTAAMLALAEHAHAIKVSHEDLDHFRPALEATAPRARLQILTEGAAGVRYRSRDHGDWTPWRHEPSHLQGQPVDTIGAGDAFTASAVTALQEGRPPAEVVAAGSDAAAMACQAAGARGDMTDQAAWFADDVPWRCGRCERDDER
ncbi:carbohydrate kinase family protein [uncultured Aeromicrobium sp.]|uniref:carbohydrate kinase family protein n=1 Tax=uncultured Aeromicrobium sp. TaxID=337820 RepID=UPI0025EDEDAF|nr:carbohydrate kinase family protein [uncultured Aeromicrobium sp.]